LLPASRVDQVSDSPQVLQERIFRKQKNALPRARTATDGVCSTLGCAPSVDPILFLRKDSRLHQHRRCVYNFCRRLPAYPAGTQCQSEETMNVTASNHECGMPYPMKRSHPSRYDIKQKQSECARHEAVRLYPSLKCPTCKPPRDANIEKKTRPGHWMRETQRKGKNKRSLKSTRDD